MAAENATPWINLSTMESDIRLKKELNFMDEYVQEPLMLLASCKSQSLHLKNHSNFF